MRIGVNARFLLKGKMEGIGLFTFETLKIMALAHPEDEFILFFDRPYDETFIFSENIKPVVLFPPARHAVLWYLWFEWSVSAALKKYRCDVFFSTDNFLSLRSKIPTILVVHDIAYKHFPEAISNLNKLYYNYYMPLFMQKAKSIITVSDFVKKDIEHFFPFTKGKISIAYNGCRSIFKPLDEKNKIVIRDKYSGGKPYFFYVGSVHPRKNVHRLISAFDIFKEKTKSDYKLLIAGRFAWQTGDVKTAYENALYKDDIVFLNYVEDNVLAELMASAFALTYVSLFEGFGVPLLEAMVCEVPIITSNVSSMPEVVGEGGICVNPTSLIEISDAMNLLYNNTNLIENLIEKSKLQRQKFDWSITSNIIYKILKNNAL